ncbi:TRAP transporter small permease subunit [Chloroflexota bacterium]
MRSSGIHIAGRVAKGLVAVVTKLVDSAGFLGGITIVAMVVLIVIDSLLRYLFRAPLQWAYELNMFLLVGMLYLGLAYTQAREGHIRVSIVFVRLPQKTQLALEVATRIVMLGVCALLIWGGWEEAWLAYQQHYTTFGLIQLPTFPSLVIIPVGAFLICLRLIIEIVRYIRAVPGRYIPAEVPEMKI